MYPSNLLSRGLMSDAETEEGFLYLEGPRPMTYRDENSWLHRRPLHVLDWTVVYVLHACSAHHDWLYTTPTVDDTIPIRVAQGHDTVPFGHSQPAGSVSSWQGCFSMCSLFIRHIRSSTAYRSIILTEQNKYDRRI